MNLKPSYSEIEGEIVGIFAGDGSQYFEPKSYSYEVYVHFGFKNKEYALYVKKLYEDYFNKIFELKNERNKTLRLKTKSKDIFYYFHHYLSFISKTKHSTVMLKKLNMPIEFKIGFIRGLIDTDGSVYKNKNGKGVVFYTTSENLAKQVKSILNEFKIKFGFYIQKRPEKGYKDLYNIKIYKEDFNLFMDLVKPFKNRLLGQ